MNLFIITNWVWVLLQSPVALSHVLLHDPFCDPCVSHMNDQWRCGEPTGTTWTWTLFPHRIMIIVQLRCYYSIECNNYNTACMNVMMWTSRSVCVDPACVHCTTCRHNCTRPSSRLSRDHSSFTITINNDSDQFYVSHKNRIIWSSRFILWSRL